VDGVAAENVVTLRAGQVAGLATPARLDEVAALDEAAERGEDVDGVELALALAERPAQRAEGVVAVLDLAEDGEVEGPIGGEVMSLRPPFGLGFRLGLGLGLGLGFCLRLGLGFGRRLGLGLGLRLGLAFAL
jgi:hypothetical protein